MCCARGDATERVLACIGRVDKARNAAHPRQIPHLERNRTLRNLGVQSGDRLAVVGEAFDLHYAGTLDCVLLKKSLSQMSSGNLSTLELKSVAERFARSRVKAVVAKNRPDVSALPNWRDVKISDSGIIPSDSVRFSVLLLSEPLPKDPLK